MRTPKHLPFLSQKAFIIILVLAGAFIIGLAIAIDGYGEPFPLKELLRDLGIALIISALVGVLIELRRSAHEETEAGARLMNSVVGSEIGAEAWDEIKTLLSSKHQMRREVRIAFEEWKPVENGLVKVKIRYSYKATSTTKKSHKSEISHELDYHLTSADAPRFESVSINGTTIDEKPVGGILRIPIELRPDTPLHVETVRYELINLPGSWNLYLTEWTKGLTVTFAPRIENINMDPVLHPRDFATLRSNGAGSWICESLLVPGQGIEFKFTNRSSTALASGSTPSQADAPR